jgi:hypothetical protein
VPANNTKHPTGNAAKLGSEFVGNYNSYSSTGNINGQATPGDAFFRLVPIERGTDQQSALSPSNTFGADAQSNVSCLTCHRAHASAFNDATRWDAQQEFLADSIPASNSTNDQGIAAEDLKNNSYYGEDMVAKYGQFQRSLCNKCHLQD